MHGSASDWILLGIILFCLIFLFCLPYIPDPAKNWESDMDRDMEDNCE